jgi:hypothetical protein
MRPGKILRHARYVNYRNRYALIGIIPFFSAIFHT